MGHHAQHVEDALDDGFRALLVAVGALILLLLVRLLFLGPLLTGLSERTSRKERYRGQVTRREVAMQESSRRHGADSERALAAQQRVSTRVRRSISDLDYYSNEPLNRSDGWILVWGGMRGAVTLAAAQTIPSSAPHQSLIVFIAFAVATLSLLIQGTTLPLVLRRLAKPRDTQALVKETEKLRAELDEAADAVTETQAAAPGSATGDASRDAGDVTDSSEGDIGSERNDLAQRRLEARYAALLRARRDATYSSDVLETQLANLDAEQLILNIAKGEGGH